MPQQIPGADKDTAERAKEQGLVAPWHATSQGGWLVAKQSLGPAQGKKKVISKN